MKHKYETCSKDLTFNSDAINKKKSSHKNVILRELSFSKDYNEDNNFVFCSVLN